MPPTSERRAPVQISSRTIRLKSVSSLVAFQIAASS
jgi:hypothetical protein